MTVSPVKLLVDEFYGCFHFLQDSLGLECTFGDEDAGYAGFKAGTGTFVALRPDAEIVELHAAGDGSLTVLEVEDVEAEAVRLADDLLGTAVSKAAWGGRVAYVRASEPEGA